MLTTDCTDNTDMAKPRTHYPRFTWLIHGEARMSNDEGMTNHKPRIRVATFPVAHPSRVLATVSRRPELFVLRTNEQEQQ
jgi:hypothetical protein